jgi:MSHA biogenesis protein MshL
MAPFISLGLVLLLLSGCTTSPVTPTTKRQKDIKSATDSIKSFQEYNKDKRNVIPAMVLPPVYDTVSVFDGQSITFSAQKANLYQVLYSISKIAGLNLIIDKDVENNIPVTLSVKDANLEDVLNIIMQMSGCYYNLEGNILHVKEYMRKSFNISYVHSDSSFSTELGGDTLSSATSGGSSSSGSSGKGIAGKYSLEYKTPKDENNFYQHLDDNLKLLISENGKYTLNKFSGVLTVYDKKQNIDVISNFIKDIKKQFNKQVLIEAKILEVTLNKSHQLGINWDVVGNSILSAGDTLHIQQSLGLTGAVAGTVNYSSNNFSALINAIDQNGKIDTVSNPRIKVLNGQSAIISSGKLVPYWEKQVDTTQGTSTSDTQVTYNRRDVLDGITMGVTPTIMENGKIMLNVTPISSSIEGEKIYYDENGNSVATAPIINIKEAGTIIYAKDNDLVLIGGLMSTSISKNKQETPFLSSIPFFGSLFTQINNTKEKKELVILLRLKVVE